MNKRIKELLCLLGITAVFILVGYVDMLLSHDVTVLVFASLFFVVPVWSAYLSQCSTKAAAKKQADNIEFVRYWSGEKKVK